MRPKIATIDWETSTKVSYGRKANPFDKDNYVVVYGVKYLRQEPLSYYMEPLPDDWLDGVEMLVAQNAKFDLTYIWDDPKTKAYLKRGGKVWCTQYAEYILTGQQKQWASLDDLAAKYGGTLKNDEIKALWEAGVDTIDIPKDMLIDYLNGDLSNTEIVFLKQVARARELGMMKSIATHMEALLALTEMEYNGLYIDQKASEEHLERLLPELNEVITKLESYIPDNLPPEASWNWGSKDHLSALFFGGGVKYKKSVHKQDPDTGEYLYTKKTEAWYLKDDVPVDPATVTDTSELDRYKSGAKAGKLKTKKVDVQGDPKTVITEFSFELEGLAQPLEKWMTKKEGVFKTDVEVLLELKEEGVEAASLMLEWRRLDKDIGTYYKRYDEKKSKYVGMLTLVQPDGYIHHTLNNVSTVTGRLSASNPNAQNIPNKKRSRVKELFASRFGTEGRVCEVDYSQLEVVIQGWDSGDKNLMDDINSGVDFHVKRLATKLEEEYDEVFRKAKIEELPAYVEGRQDSKQFSFQRAYGAGAPAIAEETGMALSAVKEFIKAEEKMYPGVLEYNERVKESVLTTKRPSGKMLEVDDLSFIQHSGYYTSPTGKRYVFKEEVAPPFMRRKPKWAGKDWTPTYTSFSPTQTKNYPIQGLAGEVVLLSLGKLFRKLLAEDNYGGNILLTNTVHDCAWLDSSNEHYAQLACQVTLDIFTNADKLIEAHYEIPCPVKFRAEAEYGPNMLSMTKYHE